MFPDLQHVLFARRKNRNITKTTFEKYLRIVSVYCVYEKHQRLKATAVQRLADLSVDGGWLHIAVTKLQGGS